MGTSGDDRRHQGYEAFFDAHYDEVVRSLTLATGDRDRAEDAAQEAFARAYRRWQDVMCMERPVGWVTVVGVNQMKRWLARADRQAAALARRDQRRLLAREDPLSSLVDAAPIRDALEHLSPRQRATVVLRILCDLSTREVADAMGCSPGTVKSALHSALAKLRTELDDAEALDRPAGWDDGPMSAMVVCFAPAEESEDHDATG